MAKPTVGALSAALVLCTLAAGCGGGGGGGTTPSDGTGTIGAAGGTVSLAGGVKLQVPAGALASEQALTIAATGASGPSGNPIYAFGPSGTTFASPVTVTLPRPSSLAAGAAATVYWTKAGSTTAYDALPATVGAEGVTAQVTHFSQGFVGAPCTEGASCGEGIAACQTGATACASGAPVCTASGSQPDGTACGAASTCSAGACVASPAVRDVVVRMVRTHWPEGGTKVTVIEPDIAQYEVPTLLVASAGGYTRYPATRETGGWRAQGVPVGRYLLWMETTNGSGASLYELSTSTPTFETVDARRPDVTPVTTATSVTLNVTGMVPWVRAGGHLFVTASQVEADVWPLSGAPRPAAGATSFSTTFDWSDTLKNALQGGLPDPARGDVLYVLQRQVQTIENGAYPATHAWTAASARLSAFPAFADGRAVTIDAALTAPAAFTMAADVRTSQYAALAAELGPGVVPAADFGFGFAVFSVPNSVAGPDMPGFIGRQGYLQLPAGAPDHDFGELSFGSAFDGRWKKYRQVLFPLDATLQAPGATATSSTLQIMSLEPLDPPPAGPMVPRVGPVLAPKVGGLDATADIATPVGTEPVISWSPPALGTPTAYMLSISRLDVVGGATAEAPVLWTKVYSGTSFRVPPGILVAGARYVAFIRSVQAPWDVLDTNPYAQGTPAHYTPRLTGQFTP